MIEASDLESLAELSLRAGVGLIPSMMEIRMEVVYGKLDLIRHMVGLCDVGADVSISYSGYIGHYWDGVYDAVKIEMQKPENSADSELTELWNEVEQTMSCCGMAWTAESYAYQERRLAKYREMLNAAA